MKNQKRFTIFFISISFIALALLFSQCKKEKDAAFVTPVADATINGRVVAPSGKPIGSAEITAGKYATLSDKNGDFSLKVVAGTYKLVIQTGDGHVFRTELDVTVGSMQTIVLPEPDGVLKQVGALAFIPGNYDHIETVIIDSLGYTATALTLNDLSNLSTINAYAALFFNCGLLEMSGITMDSTKYANLHSFLAGNGSIYASDFAVECLTGDGFLRPSLNPNMGRQHHEKTGSGVVFSCITPQIGGFIEDSSLCTSKSGNVGMINNAHIDDAGIVNLLGKDSLDVFYDLGGWEKISLLDTPFSAAITDNNLGNGVLAAKMDIDYETPGGVIFYTTFHTHPQGAISEDVQKILEYFILNL